jgi:hypothetical protein
VHEWPAPPPSKLSTVLNKVKSKVLGKEMASNVDDKPIRLIHPDQLPDATKDDMVKSLSAVIDHTSSHSDLTQSIHAHGIHLGIGAHWIHKLIPGLEKLYA